MRTLPGSRLRPLVLMLVSLVLSACGSHSSEPSGPEWVTLIGRSWTAASGDEATVCRRIQATSDWNITGFRAEVPTGQFRLIVTTSASAGTTGDFSCDFGAALAGTRMIYSAGVGTGEIVFPEDIGIRVRAGEYVTLLVQVSNQTVAQLSGTTTVTARQSPAGEVTIPADMIFAGTVNISIPDNGLESLASGGCTATQAWTAFALLPALKPLGTHLKVTVTPSGGMPQVLHDEAFNPASQPFATITPAVTVDAGGTFNVTATWFNNTGHVVTYGPGPDNEWAFAGVYRYPAAPPAAGAMLGCVS